MSLKNNIRNAMVGTMIIGSTLIGNPNNTLAQEVQTYKINNNFSANYVEIEGAPIVSEIYFQGELVAKDHNLNGELDDIFIDNVKYDMFQKTGDKTIDAQIGFVSQAFNNMGNYVSHNVFIEGLSKDIEEITNSLYDVIGIPNNKNNLFDLEKQGNYLD